MTLVVRKLEVPEVGQLQSLVMEHLDGIEPGLTVLDTRVLLGHASVDIVAIDARGTLVLVSAGFTADEAMLLKAVETYSWSLEYPEAVQQLYPAVVVLAVRSPRLMFVVERLPDAFHRKIKQLGFSEVDCVEFRHLDVGGTSVVYFDTIARLRRGPALAETEPAPNADRVPQPPRRTPDATSPTRAVVREHTDNVVPLVTPPTAPRVGSVRPQKTFNGVGSGHGSAAAPVIDIAPRVAAAPVRVDVASPRAAAATVAAAVIEPRVEERVEPVEVAPAPSVGEATAPTEPPMATSLPAPRTLFAEIARELRGVVATEPTITAHAVEPKAHAPAAEPAAAAPPAADAAPVVPQEFEGLTFPNDGVLTRQWMDFLNQMASSK